MEPVSKAHMTRTCCDKLSVLILAWSLAGSQEAIPIIFFQLIIVGRCPYVTVIDHDLGALLDYVPVGQFDVICGLSAKGSYFGISISPERSRNV
jgi:hypothetical protein